MNINDHGILGGASQLVNGWKKTCVIWNIPTGLYGMTKKLYIDYKHL
jgi:hypothetical protein